MTEEEKKEMSKNILAILGIPVFIVLLFIAFIPLGIFNAWVSLKLYNWFFLPIHGFPHLNIWWIWGIGILIARYTSDPVSTEDDKKPTKFIGKLIGRIIVGLLALLLGYVLKGHIHA